MEHQHPLKSFRERQDPPLSQGDLATLLGVQRATVWRWEAGARKIEDDKLTMVSEKTGIPPGELRPDLAELMNPSPSTAPADPVSEGAKS